jgi:hypothetical protein
MRKVAVSSDPGLEERKNVYHLRDSHQIAPESPTCTLFPRLRVNRRIIVMALDFSTEITGWPTVCLELPGTR